MATLQSRQRVLQDAPTKPRPFSNTSRLATSGAKTHSPAHTCHHVAVDAPCIVVLFAPALVHTLVWESLWTNDFDLVADISASTPLTLFSFSFPLHEYACVVNFRAAQGTVRDSQTCGFPCTTLSQETTRSQTSPKASTATFGSWLVTRNQARRSRGKRPHRPLRMATSRFPFTLSFSSREHAGVSLTLPASILVHHPHTHTYTCNAYHTTSHRHPDHIHLLCHNP